jgi:threonine synthase
MLGRERIRTFMLSPDEGMSPVQAAQMWGVRDPRVFNLTVPTFDDGQRIFKEVSSDAVFKEQYCIGSINSVNLARIIAQVSYWFWACLRLNGLSGEPFHVAVPTGNFGDIFSAYLAKLMGLPIRCLILATNENNILDRFFWGGEYRPVGEVIHTINPSMDIRLASNFERYLYYLFDGDTDRVATLMNELASTGRIDLTAELARILETGFVSLAVRREESIGAIRDTYERYGIVIDPHTAAAMRAAFMFVRDDVPIVIAATAHPCKFDAVVQEALGMTAPRPEGLAGIEDRPLHRTPIAPTAEAVKEFITRNV